jgi:hypothetical protein
MRPCAIAKHVGIMTGPDHFIHAYERLGVIEEALTRSWERRLALAFLFPGDQEGGFPLHPPDARFRNDDHPIGAGTTRRFIGIADHRD